MKEKWELKSYCHQIADTGDYDGHYEITNGKISIFTKDDDDESLQPIVDALNNSGAKFYLDDSVEFENGLLKMEIEQLKAANQLREKENNVAGQLQNSASVVSLPCAVGNSIRHYKAGDIVVWNGQNRVIVMIKRRCDYFEDSWYSNDEYSSMCENNMRLALPEEIQIWNHKKDENGILKITEELMKQFPSLLNQNKSDEVNTEQANSSNADDQSEFVYVPVSALHTLYEQAWNDGVESTSVYDKATVYIPDQRISELIKSNNNSK